jgi:hypothetical protein
MLLRHEPRAVKSSSTSNLRSTLNDTPGTRWVWGVAWCCHADVLPATLATFLAFEVCEVLGAQCESQHTAGEGSEESQYINGVVNSERYTEYKVGQGV